MEGYLSRLYLPSIPHILVYQRPFTLAIRCLRRMFDDKFCVALVQGKPQNTQVLNGQTRIGGLWERRTVRKRPFEVKAPLQPFASRPFENERELVYIQSNRVGRDLLERYQLHEGRFQSRRWLRGHSVVAA